MGLLAVSNCPINFASNSTPGIVSDSLTKLGKDASQCDVA